MTGPQQSIISSDRIPPRPSSTVLRLTEDVQVRIDLAKDEHEDSVTLEFVGVQVAVTKREVAYAVRQGTDPETRLVLIDQSEGAPPIAVYLNDDVVIDTSR